MKAEYEVLFGEHDGAIKKLVEEYMFNGWQCQGGVCVHNTGYYQAMIRETRCD